MYDMYMYEHYYTYDHVKHHVININMNLIFTISIALNHDIPVISTDWPRILHSFFPPRAERVGTGQPGGAGVFSAPGRFEKKNCRCFVRGVVLGAFGAMHTRDKISFSPWRHAMPATRAATRAVWVRVAKLGAPWWPA